MISSRILRVSGRINGSSKFQIRSVSAKKDSVQGHTAEYHAQAVLPPRTTDRQQPGNDPGWKIFGAAVAIVAGCLTVYVQSKPVVRDIQSYLPSFLERSVVSTIALDDLLGDDRFTPRLGKQNEIRSILERTKANGKYFVVYGAKGAGKSLLVDQATKDHSGVIKLMVTSITTKDDIVKSLAEYCGVAHEFTPNIPDFVKALSKGAVGKKLLTVIFEVERGGTPDQAIGTQAVRSLAKEFATVSNCIIILSEANAVLEFGRDDSRENIIFIDGFTEVEARDYLKRQKLSITESEITGVFARIGTSPAMLLDMNECVQNEGYSVEQFVNKKLRTAYMELAAFPLKPILKALKEHPEGVSPDFFDNMNYKGVDLSDPQAVGYAMKRSNAIVYRIENQKYQLLSKAHETALQTYEPIIVA